MNFQVVWRERQEPKPHLFVVCRELLAVDKFISRGFGAFTMVFNHDASRGQIDLRAILVE